jgi:hypothetical protein
MWWYNLCRRHGLGMGLGNFDWSGIEYTHYVGIVVGS